MTLRKKHYLVVGRYYHVNPHFTATSIFKWGLPNLKFRSLPAQFKMGVPILKWGLCVGPAPSR